MNYIEFKIDADTKFKKYMAKQGFSSRAIDELIKAGYTVNDIKTSGNNDLKVDDILKIEIAEENLDYEPIEGSLDIVYEDDHILVVNKPSNLTVNSKNQTNLANYIAYYFKENDIKAKVRFVNRLDMNTSGLIMIAKNKFAQSYYQKEIENERFKKLYIAVVAGELDINREVKVFLSYDKVSKRYDVSSEGDLAITYFKTRACAVDKSVCFIMADIKTGKTHQIRSTLSYLDHPIVGDKLYGSSYELDRFLLHCFEISFNKFLSGEKISLLSKPDFPKISEI